MTDRKQILWGITDSDDKLFLSKMCDIAEKSEISHKTMFSRFLDPKQILLVKRRLAPHFDISFYGGYDDAERCIAAFGEVFENGEVPICALKIVLKSKDVFSHRDFLGSVLALGIKREHIGDIAVNGNEAVVFSTNEIADFIMLNLKKVASATAKIYILENPESEIFEKSFKQTDLTVSSMRLDCIVSAATGKSRSQSAQLIDEGMCRINYDEEKNSSVQIKNGDVLSIRGVGKMIIETDSTTTKKGRIHIRVKKYI